ncbi:Zinc-type alcohol dehydrogenase-like protein PB24D3.08c [Cytospora mali]|uniref:Dehydrogenase FUB6 n=1 Tax=Cytospora mali TaxID=578113 RepID=A0A194W7Y8_CYTMA|nr:Zinc-type alcohol dehydrogenase-like protein PB24D3.08c [Valsa mali]
MTTPNKTFIFKQVPNGFPVPGEHLTTEDRPIDLDAVPEGGLVVKNLVASFDPYLRGRMRDSNTKSYVPPFEINGPVVNSCAAKVLKSNNPDYKEGDLVVATVPIAEYAYVQKDAFATKRCYKIHNPYNIELGVFVGQLGMPGLTAYSSLYKIGQPKKGETIFVSSAAGAVGQVVGQIAKHEGLRVIGSVGSDEKLDFITKELGFDAGTNYKKESPADALKRLAPDGIDIYYENVGGETLDAALAAMNPFGRVVCCGMISQYNVKGPSEQYGVKNLTAVVTKRLTMEGFIVSDPKFGPVYAMEHQKNMQKWLSEGTFKAKLSVTEGIGKAAEGFVGLLEGKNFGKAVLKIADA